MNTAIPPPPPWYRQRAPWFLMAGPAVVIVAGAVTFWLALAHPDGLVADDYYKRGLLVERRLERDAAAARLGLRAVVAWDRGERTLRVEFQGLPELTAPPILQLRHAARPEFDRRVSLSPSAPGIYEVPLPELARGRWGVILETEAWRLEGAWLVPQQTTLELRAGS
ncbi:MAG: FixH family protein [Betaproteobacteria bacterium]|nr:FixH family protein [Betaproteobacteria bacterium]